MTQYSHQFVPVLTNQPYYADPENPKMNQQLPSRESSFPTINAASETTEAELQRRRLELSVNTAATASYFLLTVKT